MQSLGPARGQARRKGSADALLARGVATARIRPACPCLPAPAVSSPEAPRPASAGSTATACAANGSSSACCFWRALCFSRWIGGRTDDFDALNGGVEKLAVAAGFGVKRITVEGQSHATDAEITAALKAGARP